MAETESEGESLREMIHSKILYVRDCLNQADVDLDVQGVLEIVDVLMQCVVQLDSFENVSEQVWNSLMQARDLLSRNTNIQRDRSHTTERSTNAVGTAGKLLFYISKEQIEYLMIATSQLER